MERAAFHVASPTWWRPGQARRARALARAFFPNAAATKTAVASGNWFDGATWSPAGIPSGGDWVHIPDGLSITYNGTSPAALKAVRVDGTLSFSPSIDTRMVVDTLLIFPSGTLELGTPTSPIAAHRTCEILFDTSSGPLWEKIAGSVYHRSDMDDPSLLSRGLISHGIARIHGADKLDHTTTSGNLAAGATSITLTESPAGWRVGDEIVVMGTGIDENGTDTDNSRFRDEVLTITGIVDNTITFTNKDTGNNSLRWDHAIPAPLNSYGLEVHVANLTRNVILRTNDAANVATKDRGHVMFMHNDDVDIQNALFLDLGRTDKGQSKIIDPEIDEHGVLTGGGDNPRGRYALHFHRTGAMDANSTPALARGNVARNSPGWGIVHHDSHLHLYDNVVFDIEGGGIVAEDGSEIGRWENNIVIKMHNGGQWGVSVRASNSDERDTLNFATDGDAFWFQGTALIEAIDNYAFSCAGSGFSVNAHAVMTNMAATALPSHLQFLADGEATVSSAIVPVENLSGFVTGNANIGMNTWFFRHDRNGMDGHNLGGQPAGKADGTPSDLRSEFRDFTFYGLRTSGILIGYAGRSNFIDGVIISDLASPAGAAPGLYFSVQGNASDFIRCEIAGWNEAATRVSEIDPSNNQWSDHEFATSRFIDCHFHSNTTAFVPHRELLSGLRIPSNPRFADYQELENNTFTLLPGIPNALPAASFTWNAIGGESVQLDASSSFDTDGKYVDADGSFSDDIGGNRILAYHWDFSDGTSHFGRHVTKVFPQAGTYQATLTVYDSQGQTGSVAQAVTVDSIPLGNALMDGGFEDDSAFSNGSYPSIGDFDRGWIAWENWTHNISAGRLEWQGSQSYNKGGASQVVRNSGTHRGAQDIRLKVYHQEGDTIPNVLKVRIGGSNEKFRSKNDFRAPYPLDFLDYDAVSLYASENLLAGLPEGQWVEVVIPDIDFGSGYQYLVIQVWGDDVDTTAGDLLWIDDVSIEEAGGAFTETGGVLSMESEHGFFEESTGTTVWSVITGDNAASNSTYIENSVGQFGSAPSGSHTGQRIVSYPFVISTSGNFTLWTRLRAPGSGGSTNSFFWRIPELSTTWQTRNDGYFDDLVFGWIADNPSVLNAIAPGQYTLEITYREVGTELDKFVLQLDNLAAPTGNGPTESPF